MGSLGNTPAGTRERMAHNRAKAMELRIGGMSYRSIAEQLGVGSSSITRYLQDGLTRLAQKETENAEQLRAIQHERLEGIVTTAMNIAANDGTTDEIKLRALETIRRTVETIARLFGLNVEQAIVSVDQRSVTFVIQQIEDGKHHPDNSSNAETDGVHRLASA